MKKNTNEHHFAFSRENYIIMIAGVVIMFIGYLLMAGGGSDDPKVFSEEIFSFRRITLAPLMVILGLIILFVAILKKPKI